MPIIKRLARHGSKALTEMRPPVVGAEWQLRRSSLGLPILRSTASADTPLLLINVPTPHR